MKTTAEVELATLAGRREAIDDFITEGRDDVQAREVSNRREEERVELSKNIRADGARLERLVVAIDNYSELFLTSAEEVLIAPIEWTE